MKTIIFVIIAFCIGYLIGISNIDILIDDEEGCYKYGLCESNCIYCDETREQAKSTIESYEHQIRVEELIKNIFFYE